MRKIDRRNYLKKAGLLGASGVALATAGCTSEGGDGTSTPGEDDNGGNTTTTEASVSEFEAIGQGSVNTPSYAFRVGVEDYGEPYNLDLTFKMYSASGITETRLLSGNAQTADQTVTAVAKAISNNAGVVPFQVGQAQSDYVIVAKDSIQSIKDLEGTTIGIEGIYQNAWVFTVLPMKQAGADPDTVNFRTIGFSSARTQAMMKGAVDATPLHIDQANRVTGANDNMHILAPIYEVLPNHTQTLWMTTEDMIENRRQDVVNFCKASLSCNRDLNADFSNWNKYAEEYNYAIPDNMSKQELYDFYTNAGIWLNNGGMTEERLGFIWNLLQNEMGIVENLPPYEEVVDFSITKDALADIGEA